MKTTGNKAEFVGRLRLAMPILESPEDDDDEKESEKDLSLDSERNWLAFEAKNEELVISHWDDDKYIYIVNREYRKNNVLAIVEDAYLRQKEYCSLAESK